jgi:uncharacterized protein involved in type VI secretion and phage assembly
MNLHDPFLPPPAWTQGAFLARVVSLDDPEQRSRVQVELAAFSGADTQDARLWARVVAPFAGDDRGTYFLPEVDDEVLIVFVQGDPRFPLLVGGLWNGSAAPPAGIESGGVNRFKRIRSKHGITVTLDDQQGQETLTLETPGGCRLTLQDGPGTVTLEDSNGNSIELASAGITVQASAAVTVNASSVKVSAGMVNVDAGMSSFSGVVKCDTLITNSVVSTSYTPGAGNVW